MIPDNWQTGMAAALRAGNFVSLLEYVAQYFEGVFTSEEEIVCIGIASLCTFIQLEWTGPEPSTSVLAVVEKIKKLWPVEDVVHDLLIDCDEIAPLLCPHLLLIARRIFDAAHEKFPTSQWARFWLLRTLIAQQLVLDENSSKLHQRMMDILVALELEVGESDKINYYLEVARIHLLYGSVGEAQSAIQNASKEAKLTYNFSGALGKRTRFQQENLAQLLMNIEIDSHSSKKTEKHPANPTNIPLDDDVRLEEIQFADPGVENDVQLNSQHIAILLAILMLRRKSLPDDELTAEESRTIVEKILKHKGTWPVQLSALLVRSHLERTSRRTVERAMMQVQSVLDNLASETPSLVERLDGFFISHLPSKRSIETTLAEFQLSIGAIKSALDIFLRLQNWEMAIACYNALQLRHKAQELIAQELAKKETPKLYCLLGDATDDPGCYEKAWILSEEKSSRAQRHWANYFYLRKRYGESLDHFEKSLEINSLQSDLWFRLGFAALHEEKWELGAKAYRRYCTLEPDSFEAWNNLARCYCELKQTNRAWHALKEALKVDMSNWRVWDNYMRVSVQEKRYFEAIHSYNQILEFKKENHVDLPAVMGIASGFFSAETEERKLLKKPLLDLIAKITEKPTKHASELWMIAANIHEHNGDSREQIWECLTKSHTFAVTTHGWENDVDSCKRVIDILDQLYELSVLDEDLKRLYLLTARPSISTITRCHPSLNLCDDLREKINRLQ